MNQTVWRRLLEIAVTIIGVSFISFGLLHLLPGDPAIALAGEGASQERIAQIRSELGLDRSVVVQYLDWASSALRGDLGTSFGSGLPVTERLASTVPITIQLVMASLGVSIVAGSLGGVIAALRSGTKTESAILTLTTIGIAVPNFWLGMMLIVFVAVPTPWLPTIGFAPLSEGIGPYLRHLLLPAIALSTVGIAEITRQLRGAMLEVMTSDHVRVAHAKGLTKGQVIRLHVLKNAGIPVITVLGLLVNRLVGGTVVIEAVFNIAGSGNMVSHAAATRDLPLLQGLVLVLTVFVLLTNFVVDLVYTKLDPRISHG